MLRRSGAKFGLSVEGASSSREQPLAASQEGETLEPHLQGTEFSDHLRELGKASFSGASRQEPAGATVSSWETLSRPPGSHLENGEMIGGYYFKPLSLW